jgi:hypothetical protein
MYWLGCISKFSTYWSAYAMRGSQSRKHSRGGMRSAMRTMIRYAVVLLALFGTGTQSQAADVITSVQHILSNPSAYHRHIVVLSGRLKLTAQWEGKDNVGMPTCGPIFTLEDDTGQISVYYIIRCDEQELQKMTAMAGSKAIVYATIDAITVTMNTDGSSSHIRAMATKIQREQKLAIP